MTQLEYGKLVGPEETQLLGAILQQCFNTPAFSNAAYFQRIGHDNFRIVRQQGTILGGLAMLPMGQWFGGRRVPMVGLAAVGIAPEYRGTGAAFLLLRQALEELRATQVPLSALYPATQRLYRKVGYEQGGSFCTWELATAGIDWQARSLPLEPVAANDLALFQPLYQQQARLTPGHLDRHAALWQGVTQPKEQEPVYAYVLGTVSQPQGYLIFSQHQRHESAVLRLRDWVVLTPAAAQRFWTFIADHRSQIDKLHWQDAPTSALMLLLPEQTASLYRAKVWMLRIVDVKGALEARGYPPDLQAELHLEVHDSLLPDNNGPWRLQVAGGDGEVSRGGRGELQLTIGGLVPLYTGLFTPQQLQTMGYLTASAAAVAGASQIFAGPAPWLPDFF